MSIWNPIKKLEVVMVKLRIISVILLAGTFLFGLLTFANGTGNKVIETKNYKVEVDVNGSLYFYVENQKMGDFALWVPWTKGQNGGTIQGGYFQEEDTETGQKIVFNATWLDVLNFTETVTVEPDKLILEYELTAVEDFSLNNPNPIFLVLFSQPESYKNIGNGATYSLVTPKGDEISGPLSDQVGNYTEVEYLKIGNAWGKKNIEYKPILAARTDIESSQGIKTYQSGDWRLRVFPCNLSEKVLRKGTTRKIAVEIKVTDISKK